MAELSLTINMIDKEGGNGRVTVKNIADADKAAAFVTFVKSHVDAKVTSYTLSESTRFSVDGDNASDGTYDLVNQRMVTSWIEALQDGTVVGDTRLVIPTIRNEDVDTDEQMTSAAAEDWKDALNALTGKRNVFRGGYLEIKRPANVKAKTSGV